MDISGRLSQANGRLKDSKVGVVIQQIGDRLYLRATLPPKPGSDRTEEFQQRISLGLRANPNDLSLAEKEARKVGALIACREFSWEPYLGKQLGKSESCGDWVERFTAKFKPAVAAVTWDTDYRKVLEKLPADEPLTVATLTAAIAQTEPNSRQRKRFTQTLGKLAKFAGLEVDFKDLQGSYSAKGVDPRNIPTDAALATGFHKIADPGWRWVYGMLLTYGLRNHEVFYLDTAALEEGRSLFIQVLEGKTGHRLVWPCFPEWIDEFDLRKKQLPPVTGKEHEDYGMRVTKFFARTFDYTAYDVRHRWAIRTLECRWPPEVAAAQMGHSVKVHSDTYHHWITADVYQRIFDSLMNRSDRPRPPVLG